jgi:hypothetical protein
MNIEAERLNQWRAKFNAKLEEWQRLWKESIHLQWRREDGQVRRRNLSQAEFDAMAPRREQWKIDASKYTGRDITTVNGDLLGGAPQIGPPPAVRQPVTPVSAHRG